MHWSPTFFRYIFWDLLKVFGMAAGVLSGILSFGGLLRPLMQQGLDAGQVSQILWWFTPGMLAYALPIAALFATTFVYGRLAADNEVVACRAGGMSHLSLSLPALVLGLLVASASALLLLFVVPYCTLKVEQVISSNIAKLIAGRIERTHQIKFGPVTVFAQEAHLPEPWAVLAPSSAVSAGGATLTVLRDGSVLASGPSPDQDTYTVVAPTDLRNISAVRLEVLPDPSLPGGGPGRSDAGGFMLSDFAVTAAPPSDPAKAVPVKLSLARVTSERTDAPAAGVVDADPVTAWSTAAPPGGGEPPPQSVTFNTRSPAGFRGGSVLTFKLKMPAGGGRTLGRFRLAVQTPGLQQVILRGVSITAFDRPDAKDKKFKVPKEFYTASEATITILQPGETDAQSGGGGGTATLAVDDELMLMIGLTNGSKFPREFRGAFEATVAVTQFGPLPIASPLKESPKFMDLWQLRRLWENHNESRKIRGMVAGFIRRDQEVGFLETVRLDLNDDDRRAVFSFGGEAGTGLADAGRDETYVIERLSDEAAREEKGEVLLAAPTPPPGTPADAATQPVAPPLPPPVPPRVRFLKLIGGKEDLRVEGAELHLRARPVRDAGTMEVSIEVANAVSQKQGSAAGAAPRRTFTYAFRTPMPGQVKRMENHTYKEYLKADVPGRGAGERQRLSRELAVLENDIRSESNARISFSLSCVVLVMVGCALGMMFRSGNFLTAFAVSFVPALLAITLIVAGQRVCGSVPLEYPTKGSNPVQLGLSLIWLGNAVNVVLACGLWTKMQRQ